MKEHHAQTIQARLIPPPQKFTAKDYSVWSVRDGAAIRLLAPMQDAAETVTRFFRIHFHAEIAVEQQNAVSTLPPEGYKLDVSQDCCTISADTLQGLRYALHTIRQLAESERGVLTSRRKQLPCVAIEDYPATAFRGIHLCWFPETPVWEIERQIRLAAYYKFNYAVIESWGVLKFDRHPEFCWQEYAVEKAEFRRLIKLGDELGIRLVPQLNLFGHATCARLGAGKHMLLDQHPEYEPLFEPDGWTWCISNPAARQYLAELVEELLDLYENPPYFHIGCDEAYTPESCSMCMENYLEKLADHIRFFHDMLSSRGIKTMMWHDMLLAQEDPRWSGGYIACGHQAEGHDTLHTMLPKSIIICDWQYNYPVRDKEEPEWITSNYLKSLGFPVVVCPWDDPKGGLSLGKCVVRAGLDGYLQTVWHHGTKSARLHPIFVQGAHGAWSPEVESLRDKYVYLNYHLRQLSQEMGLNKYHQFGSVQYQVDTVPYQD